ncbi:MULTISPECIES: SDR family oxidoreductase [Polyangium]|uniref:SDR family oxidoreductase n=2 Tax=Polyangium TaxID=55 RepID=A0A4U1J9F4_9BACT|nr:MULTISPECIES: SDR family oxidoreductase [Polyangium]MDI1432490.1 SDR family oxidoreductase [Polyangium sorediatum]TKD05030.1 SDR family oxidoreductase [Polyangium fumosum]
MRVLIPGIGGVLGQRVARRLLEQGHEVIGIDRRPWHDAPPGIELHNVDIRKRAAEDVFRKRRPQAVIHMATVTHLVEKTAERYKINLGGTRAVFEHCRDWGVEHAIFVGRHTYYGAAADSPLYHKEEDPPMAVTTFPELSDLVAADLYACTALWRLPNLCTTVLRMAYTLGPTGHGTLATFLRGRHVPMVLGFDPLFHFMHEEDVTTAICLALEKRVQGVYNVAGPQPVPLSVVVRGTGRSPIPLPEIAFRAALGRFGLPRLPPGALAHIKYPVVVDSEAFRAATGFVHQVDEVRAMQEFRDAFPVRG